MKDSATGTQIGAKGRTKEEKEEKTDSTHQRKDIIGGKWPVWSRDTSRIEHYRISIREQILDCDNFGCRHRRADD